jgi:Flp pilus assembly protein TadD
LLLEVESLNDTWRANRTRVAAYALTGEPDKALPFARRLTEQAPEKTASWHHLAEVCRLLKQYDEAERAAFRALEIEPDCLDAHLDLASIYYEQKRPELALEQLDRAVRIDPDSHRAWGIRALVCGQLENMDEAIDSIRQAIRLKPDEAKYHGNLGTYLYLKGDHAGAVAALEGYLELRPGDEQTRRQVEGLKAALGPAVSRPASGP